MASNLSLFLCTLTTIILFISSMNIGSVQSASSHFKVGNAFGWQQPPLDNTEFYTQWAANVSFQVSDSLVFEYKNDSVASVDKWDYYHCDASDPISIFNNGNSTMNLDQPGSFYFISGLYQHCRNGQKLMVEVKSPSMNASAPSPSHHRHHSSASSLSVLLISTFFPFMFIALAVSYV
ncbi:hypothetical protein K1719_019508 [Acacia pycnantha]|nr:hypothetical protein K1719_019508 [Acacia pycnantha]